MSDKEPPACSSEDGQADQAKEHLDYNLANFHGDEQDEDSSQDRGDLQGWRQFTRVYDG